MALFSVIIPTYNRRALLEEALGSVWAQTFFDYEVIVVDDGSDDGTWEYLESLGARVRIERQKNGGPGAARNLAARISRGKYLAFLDSDDVWFPWTLQTFFNATQTDHQPSIICGKLFQFVNPKLLDGIRPEAAKSRYFDCYAFAAGEGRYAGAGMIAVSRDAFLSVGGFATDICNSEDHDLMLKMADQKGFVAIGSPTTLGRRGESDGLTTNLEYAYQGLMHLIREEKWARYPGGARLAWPRRFVITQHCRAGSFDLLKGRAFREAWNLYRLTFLWHVRQGRMRFLLGFPFKIARGLFSRNPVR